MFISTNLYNLCALTYTLALFLYAFNLGFQKNTLRQIATSLVVLGFLTQTFGMALRWFEAGLIEVEAYTQSTGELLTGIAYWKVLTQHPPWSNLYEIMVYMGWGLVLVFLVCEVKWRARFLGIFSLLLALTALGIASLNHAPIKPLVPALKSWWIMLHVISASIAYAAGTIAAICSFFYLLKVEPFQKVLFSTLAFTLFLFLLCLKSPDWNVWNLSLLGIMFVALIFISLVKIFPVLKKRLPSPEQLDHMAYSNVLVAFALVAVVLITGALWAHYAWGRYWGWDPKETGALVIWITYALYLHTRVTHGWGGSQSAMVAVLGFFVIIAGFLGVNLGWFADGLHSYGRS